MIPAQLRAAEIVKYILNTLEVRPGFTENAVAKQIKNGLKSFGAKPAFKTIVASGYRAAFPHGKATSKKIKKGELVVVDFGALYKGYRSDITRTYIMGKPTPRQKKIYALVKEAQKKAIKAVKDGVKCREVDEAARGAIRRRGFAKYFVHTTGHGVGKRIHQGPRISHKNNRRLKTGQVITIEPGIYIKGWGGVRIEDMVLVTDKGCEKLT